MWSSSLFLNFFSPYLHRFEIEVEPTFATLALYDLKEKKKVRNQQSVG